MANHRATQDEQPRSRHPSPYSDISEVRHESVKAPSSSRPVGSPHARRRPSRTHSSTKDSMRSVSPYENANKGRIKRSKRDRSTSKKIARSDLVVDKTTSSSVSQSGEPGKDWDEDMDAFKPKLGQLREDKESKPSKHRTSSATHSAADSRVRRRQRVDEDASGRLRVRGKQSPSQRRLDGLNISSNLSPASNPSTSTHYSYPPSASNSTITQDSYDKPYERERLPVNDDPSIITTSEMPSAQSNVFQYLDKDFAPEECDDGVSSILGPNAPLSSSSSSSSENSHIHDGLSSIAGENEQLNDSPATSPALTRRSNSDVSHHHHHPHHHHHHRQPRNHKVPLYASSFVHGPGSQEKDEEAIEDPEDSGQGSVEEHEANAYTVDTDHVHDPSRTVPPGTSSVSPQGSDPHARRLRQQEQDLASHVFQKPSSRKKSRRRGVPSPAPYPSMPAHDPYSPVGSSLLNPHTIEQTWSPMPYVPPPLQIGYAMDSPESTQGFPMTLQPPMVAPEAPVPQGTPVYHQPPGYPQQQYLSYTPGPDLTKTTVVGYELLAETLSKPCKDTSDEGQEGQVVPLYRKFENLNHRVLLHLQDEISELEEELRYLDECIAQTSYKDEAGNIQPASRRGDARYGNGLVYKRTELLGRIFQKLGQYNEALCSFGNVTKNLEPASTEDIQSYRRWMDNRAPIDHVESRFLEHKDDLLAVLRTKPAVGTGEAAHSSAVWLPLVLVLPLMAFAIVPNLLGRLVVLLLIGASEIRLITSTPELWNFMTVQEWTRAASM